MKTSVLDSWAILEWMNDRQPTADRVEALLADGSAGRRLLFMSAINVGEIYYFLRTNHGEEIARAWRESAATLPVTIEVPTMADIWSAAQLKAQSPIAYADAFAAALAQKHRCPLVTGDPEFKRVDQLDLDWIGRGT